MNEIMTAERLEQLLACAQKQAKRQGSTLCDPGLTMVREWNLRHPIPAALKFHAQEYCWKALTIDERLALCVGDPELLLQNMIEHASDEQFEEAIYANSAAALISVKAVKRMTDAQFDDLLQSHPDWALRSRSCLRRMSENQFDFCIRRAPFLGSDIKGKRIKGKRLNEEQRRYCLKYASKEALPAWCDTLTDLEFDTALSANPENAFFYEQVWARASHEQQMACVLRLPEHAACGEAFLRLNEEQRQIVIRCAGKECLRVVPGFLSRPTVELLARRYPEFAMKYAWRVLPKKLYRELARRDPAAALQSDGAPHYLTKALTVELIHATRGECRYDHLLELLGAARVEQLLSQYRV